MTISDDDLQALRAQIATLTGRVHRLEQAAGVPGRVEPQLTENTMPPAAAMPPAELVRPDAVRDSPRAQAPAFIPIQSPPGEALESRIGKLWLNRIGISAILIGISYFIKYAFDNGWIGPSARIALGLFAGFAVVLWSERFRHKGYVAFSYSLKALGIGTLYLSIWGAFQVYHLLPGAMAFAAMILVTASTIALALTQDSEILAAFSLIGGFSTPVLLASGRNNEVVLFAYVCLLDLATLAMVARRPWGRLLAGSFVGTALIYVGWYGDYYSLDQRALTVMFVLIFGAIFAVSPLVAQAFRAGRERGVFGLGLLSLLNAAAVFLALFAMHPEVMRSGFHYVDRATLGWYALGLAAAYLALSVEFARRAGKDANSDHAFIAVHAVIAVAFVTIAIHLMIEERWVTIGWLMESAAILLLALRTRMNFLRYAAGAILAMGVLRLLFFDHFQVDTVIFNARFGTYLVAIAILSGIVAAGYRFASEAEMPAVRLAEVILNLLALIALTLEVSDYFSQQITAVQQGRHVAYGGLQQLEFARNFSYSALWLTYGTGLMLIGFWKRSSFARWQALVLIAFTVGKVFLYDVSMLEQGYRILSFIALGAVLMGISYIYHRDWLKLSERKT